jgi:hypothetical protein
LVFGIRRHKNANDVSEVLLPDYRLLRAFIAVIKITLGSSFSGVNYNDSEAATSALYKMLLRSNFQDLKAFMGNKTAKNGYFHGSFG